MSAVELELMAGVFLAIAYYFLLRTLITISPTMMEMIAAAPVR
jgi:hypothetical protein